MLEPDSDTSESSLVDIGPPIYLVLSESGCTKCRKMTPVITVGAQSLRETEIADEPGLEEQDEEESGFCVLSSIETLPDEILAILHEYCPGYRYADSGTDETAYLMNHCLHCDAALEDFDMHEEPGGAFLPETADECRKIVLVELPFKKRFQLSCSYSMGPEGDFVLTHAARKIHRG